MDIALVEQRTAIYVVTIVKLVNWLRADFDLQPLQPTLSLMRSAQAKADYMYVNDSFGHNDLEGKPFNKFIERVTGRRGTYGENLALGDFDADKVFERWSTSPGYYENMINPRYRHIGVGERHLYWVQHFAA